MDYIGIDFGTKCMGLSWGNDELAMAVPLPAILHFQNLDQVFSQLKSICLEKGCQAFVVGLPLHMNGTEGTRAQEVRYFADQLTQYFNKPVYFQDERLSTQAAQYLSGYHSQSLEKSKKQKQRGIIDSQAATIILQDFLDEKHR